ncbi:Kelch repeat-containing protein [Streptomyces zingiberis]|uniref:Kelch repeat-containing protein n=1 Tax=Streptomyces zingiberis TaxID=2053010 RepID=A0ABX1C645_9ACTN|nr:kelch repeat-containing protein [Streptomyces zingiberis]NJQ03159.1 kelch repeat-containing protein [Streptomyces zingiberis]
MKSNRRTRTAMVSLALAAAMTAGGAAVPAHAHEGHPPAAGEGPLPADPHYGRGWHELPGIEGGPRQEHSVAALGEKIYVLGGIVPEAGGVTTVDRVEVFDTRTRRWSEAAPLPVPMNHPNVAAVDGRIYVLGGLTGGASWEATGASFVYDPKRDRWSSLPPVPREMVRGSAAMGVKGRTVHLAGGMRTLTPGPGGLQDTVDTVSAYDVDSGRWRDLAPLPQARDHVGGAVVGSTFYVLGGRDRGQVNVRDTVYALDLRTGRWAERAPMPTARGGLAASAVGGKIYTFGGEGNPAPGSNSIFDEAEVYDTARDRWQRLAPMPVPRHGTAAATVGDTVHIPGGGTAAGGAPVATNDAYRPNGHGHGRGQGSRP